jgi:hypothetical protein
MSSDAYRILHEPPYAERHVRWCERWGAVRLPTYSIVPSMLDSLGVKVPLTT